MRTSPQRLNTDHDLSEEGPEKFLEKNFVQKNIDVAFKNNMDPKYDIRNVSKMCRIDI